MSNKNMNAKLSVNFTKASTKQNITSDENISTSFGKIAKYLDDLGSAAFTDSSDYATLTDLSNKVDKVTGKELMPSDLLDANGDVALSHLPDIVLGQMIYGGTVNASNVATLSSNAKTKLGTTSNTITLTNNTTSITGYVANEGIYYIATGNATLANLGIKTGDWLLSTGSAWSKIDNTDEVSSVNNKTGAVTLNASDVSAVSTSANQGLTDTEKANARTNIGAGTSSFSGSYNDLSNKPTIPTVNNGTLFIQKNGTNVATFTANQAGNTTANITLAKADVGLTNVDNTSDANKPISTATQTALNAQQAQIDDNSEISEITDTTPYLYKASEHDAVYDELVGGSVVVNQLVENGNFESTSGWTGYQAQLSVSNNVGNITFSTNLSKVGHNVAAVANHVYVSCATIKANDVDSQPTFISYIGANGIFKYVKTDVTTYQTIYIVEKQSTVMSLPQLQLRNTAITLPADTSIQVKNVMCIDLTLMFAGTTIADYVYTLEQSTAGSGIAWLKSYGFFTKDYYAYNAGELMSVNTSGKKVVGKNLVEETISGSNIDNTGRIVSQTSFSMHIAKVIKGKTYTLTSEMLNKVVGFFYDKPVLGSSSYDSSRLILDSNIITSPIDGYVAFRSTIEYTTPQCELGSTATDYELYTELTYPLQSTDLRGLFKLNGNKLYTDGDIYSADGTVTRKYGIVDLGTLDWVYDTSYANPFMRATFVDGISGTTNIICQRGYRPVSMFVDVVNTNLSMCIVSNSLRVRDDSYTNATTFKTAMSGVYLIYELATPTTGTAQSFTSSQMVYRNGTEEYLDTRDVPIPVGGNRKYVDIPDWMVNEYFDDVRAFDGVLNKAVRVERAGGDSGNLVFPDGIHEINWDDDEGVIDFSNVVTHFTSSQDILLQSNEIQINCPETDEYGGLYLLSVDGEKANSHRYPAIRLEESSSGNNINIRNNAINLLTNANSSINLTTRNSINLEYDSISSGIPGGGIMIDSSGPAIHFGDNSLTLDHTALKYNGNTLPVTNITHAGFHNSIYRGKYLGTSYTSAQKAQVQAGTFDDLFVGDYWTINGINWRIAHFDYYLNTGDTQCTKHHIVVVPDTDLATSYMNSTDITTNAYVGSYMYTTTLLQDGTEADISVFGKIKAAFGESNLLSIRQLFSNAVDSNGNVSGWSWYSTRCFLMNQAMVYGQKAWSNGNNDGYNVGIDKNQLALFAHDTSAINKRYTYWLRDVRSSTYFAGVSGSGLVGDYGASTVLSVRPVFLLKGA